MFEARSTIFIRRALIVVLLGAMVAVLTARVVDPARSARAEMLDRHLGRLETLNGMVQRDNQRLEARLASLEDGVDGWKELARREHGMLLPGEVIFRFPVETR